MRHQSIAKRKQTTASPEKIPMNTDKIRKNRSSRNIDRKKVLDGCSADRFSRTRGSAFKSVPFCKPGWSTLAPLMQLCNQQQRSIRFCGRGRTRAGFALNPKDQFHGGFYQVRVPV